MKKTIKELLDLFMGGEVEFLEKFFDLNEELKIGENEIEVDEAYARINVGADWKTVEIVFATEATDETFDDEEELDEDDWDEPASYYYVLSFDDEGYYEEELMAE